MNGTDILKKNGNSTNEFHFLTFAHGFDHQFAAGGCRPAAKVFVVEELEGASAPRVFGTPGCSMFLAAALDIGGDASVEAAIGAFQDVNGPGCWHRTDFQFEKRKYILDCSFLGKVTEPKILS